MKLGLVLVALSIPLITSCSKEEPVYPHVGLKVYLDGKEAATCGFFMTDPLEGPPGVEVTMNPKSMRYADANNEVNIEWVPDLTGTEDRYDLRITADGVSSRQRVSFEGRRTTIIEQPFTVVMDNVYFGNNQAQVQERSATGETK